MTVFGIPQPRIPEIARIRAGSEREGGRWGKPLEHFRFTGSRVVMDRVADVYGGEVIAWRDEFQVLTSAPSIRVVLPADPLALSVDYAQFDAGGRMLRRCDAAVCESYSYEDGPEGIERVETTAPCTCASQREAGTEIACDCRTRLTVLCPELRLGGSCMFTSSSDQVARFMLGSLDAARMLQPVGRLSGWLSIVPGKRSEGGYTYSLTMLQLDIADVSPGGSGGEIIAPPTLPPPPAAKPQIEPPGALLVDAEADKPQPERPKRPQVKMDLVLEGATTSEAALAAWQSLIREANAEELRALRSSWIVWSNAHPELAMSIGAGLTREFKAKREGGAAS